MNTIYGGLSCGRAVAQHSGRGGAGQGGVCHKYAIYCAAFGSPARQRRRVPPFPAGFVGEVKHKYTAQMADVFRETFCWLPLGFVVGGKVLVVSALGLRAGRLGGAGVVTVEVGRAGQGLIS